MNRHERRRRAVKVGDVVDVSIGLCRTKGNETLICYACDGPATVISAADDTTVYGFASINNGEPVPLCAACVTSRNSIGVVRKFWGAPNLEISEGGTKSIEEIHQIASALAESANSAHH
jgi:hypothetical protein